jgi:hypothetical protein
MPLGGPLVADAGIKQDRTTYQFTKLIELINCHINEGSNALSDAVLPTGHDYLCLRSRFVVLLFGVTLRGCCRCGRGWP